MEKTIEILLTEQRDAIYNAILNAKAPEARTWIHAILFEQAKIQFARLALETRIPHQSGE